MNAGTPDPAGEAFARLRAGLRAFVRSKVPDGADADDIVQDIFLKFIESGAQSGSARDRPIRNIGGWMYAVARTAIADHYRTRRIPTDPLDEMQQLQAAVEDDESVALQSLAECISPMVGLLPEEYRETLKAVDLRGEPMAGIASREGLTVSAIKSRAARGRTLLRKKLLACCELEVAGGTIVDVRHKSAARSCGGSPPPQASTKGLADSPSCCAPAAPLQSDS